MCMRENRISCKGNLVGFVLEGVVIVTLGDWNNISLRPEHLIRKFGGMKR